MKKLLAGFMAILISASLCLTVYAEDSVIIDFADLAYQVGDVNCDGEINSDDLILLRKHLVDIEEVPSVKTADVFVDEKIDILDLVRLKKAIAVQTEVQ